MNPRIYLVLTLAFLAVSPVMAQPRNVTVATYNVQQIPEPHDHNGHYFDENGDPLSDSDRAHLIAANIKDALPDIIALNEVFDEDSRDIFISELGGVYGFHVDKIGAGDPEDSGLMLFSRFPFEKMEFSGGHTYGCGDAQITMNANILDCTKEFLGFVEFQCDGSYSWDIANQPDCVSDKGAGIVKIGLPSGESLFVVFSHFVSTYGDDSEDIKCAKADDRRTFFKRISNLVVDATEVPVNNFPNSFVFSPDTVNIIALGDFNIDGNPFRTGGSQCQRDEWRFAYHPTQALIDFPSCGPDDRLTCGASRLMVDAWAFDTSVADLGRTNGMPFSFDVTDTSLSALATGQRLDHILYRRHSPSVPALHPNPMIPQHLTIQWPLSGSQGRLSDHLPVGVDLLLPPEDIQLDHVTPRLALPITVPATVDPPDAYMSIDIPGQMQWILLDGPKGTYSLRTYGTDVGFAVYQPEDLSRPVKPHKKTTRDAWEYVLTDPPYFIRTFAADASGQHDRNKTGAYYFDVHRYDCTSSVEPCHLPIGSEGQDIEWPSNPVGPADSYWFTFDADDAQPSQSPFHELAVTSKGAPTPVPAFDLTILDPDTLQQPQNLVWSTTNPPATVWSTRVSGLANNGSSNPLASVKTYLLQLQRTQPSYTGQVAVSHASNLTYFVPLTIQVLQENDDSKHDELMIFHDADGAPLHQVITQQNAHTLINHFTHLPQIDEREDGGSPWPAHSLGIEKYTIEMPLIMLEDDDDCCGAAEGDYLLTELSSGQLSTSGGLALAELPLNETKRQIVWRWSDKSPLPGDPDDTDYWYELDMIVSHQHPCSFLTKETLAACP